MAFQNNNKRQLNFSCVNEIWKRRKNPRTTRFTENQTIPGSTTPKAFLPLSGSRNWERNIVCRAQDGRKVGAFFQCCSSPWSSANIVHDTHSQTKNRQVCMMLLRDNRSQLLEQFKLNFPFAWIRLIYY